MRLRFLSILLLTTALARTTRGAERLHDITSIEDLRQLEPVHLDDDWDVRVGLADGGKDAGPWKVLYCLATWRKEGNPPGPPESATHDAIGPLCYQVTEAGMVILDRGMMMDQKAHRLLRERAFPPHDYLYASIIPLLEKKTVQINVLDSHGHLLAETLLDIAAPAPAMWCNFTNSSPQGSGELTVKMEGEPACPRIDSADPMLCFTADGRATLPDPGIDQVKQAEYKPGPDQERPNNLPGGLPLAPQWQDLARGKLVEERVGRNYPLKLALEKNVFVITSPAKIFDETDEKFLVRWWVNAKPIAFEIEGKCVFKSGSARMARMSEWHDTVRIAMRFPDYLGKLAEGDVVRVQVLYCPQGYEPLNLMGQGLTQSEQMEQDIRGDIVRPTFPLQTNSVSFEVTAEMLKTREKK